MKWIRRLGIAMGALVALAVVGVAGAWGYMTVESKRTFDVPTRPITVVHDSAAVARGKHFVEAIGKCEDCHGADLGGSTLIDHPVMGVVAGSNLTSGKGGVLARYTDEQLVRAIRAGVAHDGRQLGVMPSYLYQELADEDVAGVVAYLRSLAPIDRELPRTHLRPVGAVMVLTGAIDFYAADDIDHTVTPPKSKPAEETVEYGRYLSVVGGCAGCHGPGLSGGYEPGAPKHGPPPANLTPEGIGHYTEADFVRALREGIRPGGSRITEAMPWKQTAKMTDLEIRALWKYLQTVERRPFGRR